MRYVHSTSNRSMSENGAPTRGLSLWARCSGRWWMIRPSSATQGSRSSRMFHSSPSGPPGARTRATSGTARSGSIQCHAWATSTASTAPSSSGISSAVPASARVPGKTLAS